MYLTVLKQLLIMLIISLLAFVFSKKNKFGSSESSFLSRILLYFATPCLIFSSFNQEFDGEKLRDLAFVILFSLLLHLVMILAVSLLVRPEKKGGAGLSALERIGAVFTNSAFIGIPLINGVFGQEGVFYLTGYIAVFNICLWTYGEYQMSQRFSLRKVLTNPNVLAVLCGLALFCLPVRLPEIAAKPLSYISEMNTSLSMFLLGLLFASSKKTGGRPYVRRLVTASLLRLAVCPLLCLLASLAVWKLFAGAAGLRTQLFVAYIASLCPVGMSVSSFACVFGKDASFASLQVLVTSALCIVSVPTFVRIAELLIPA